MLHALVCAPFIAALITALVNSKDQRAALRWGVVSSAAIAIFGVCVLGIGSETIVSAAYPWFPLWGSSGEWVTLGLSADALSTWLVHLATIVTPLVFLAAGSWKEDRLKEFIIAALVMQGAMIGCFLAADIVLFYLFFEAMLIPVVFLVARQGDADRHGAALLFFVSTMLASIGMLVGIWYLTLKAGTSDISQLIEDFGGLELGGTALTLCFWAFTLAFAVKMPLVPFHFWQTRIYAAAPTASTALIAAIMAKVGIYGFIRLVLPLFPEQLAAWHGVLIGLAIAGTIFGALMALVQSDLKRLLAYASLGHLSLILVGVLANDETAIQGVVLQLVAHGLSVAAMFIVIGGLEHRRASRGIGDFGGLATTSPLYAVLIIGSMIAAVAMPGTAAFAGEFLILLGVAKGSGGSLFTAAVIGLSVVLTAAYLLRMTGKVVFGPAGEKVEAPKAGEAWAVCLLLVATLGLGIFPRLVTDPAAAFAQGMVKSDAKTAEVSTTLTPLALTQARQDQPQEVEGVVHGH